MHEALRRIAQEVIADADQTMLDDGGNPELPTSVLRTASPSRGRKSVSPSRGRSPNRMHSPNRARSPGFADSTYSAVQAALNKRQLQASFGTNNIYILKEIFSKTCTGFSCVIQCPGTMKKNSYL